MLRHKIKRSGPDVLALQFRIVGKDTIQPHTGGHEIEDDFPRTAQGPFSATALKHDRASPLLAGPGRG